MTTKPKKPSVRAKRVPLVAPAPLSPNEEAQVLRRSEEKLFRALAGASPETSVETPAPGLAHFGWSFGFGFAATAMVLILSLTQWPVTPKSTPLVVQGVAQTDASKGKKTLQFQASATKPAQIANPGFWEMRARPSSQFRMTRRARRHVVVALQKGGLKVEVNPKQKQKFEVQFRGARVLVRGTVFSANAQGSFLRVEVQRGHVQVSSKGRHVQLKTGRGAYINVAQKKISKTYPLPPEKSTALQRIQWVFRYDTKLALALALQHLRAAPLSARDAQTLLSLATSFKSKWLWHDAERLLMAIHKRAQKHSYGGDALFEAAVACNKQHQRGRQCQELFQRYLGEYPKGRYYSLARRYLRLMKASGP